MKIIRVKITEILVALLLQENNRPYKITKGLPKDAELFHSINNNDSIDLFFTSKTNGYDMSILENRDLMSLKPFNIEVQDV